VDVAEEALRSGVTRRLLTQDQVASIEAEFAEFRSEPTRYIQRLTSAHASPRPEAFLVKLSERIYGWKEQIRTHYNNVLDRLFTDLRIFSGSNVLAALIAFSCAWRSPRRPSLELTLISALLLAALGLGIFFYIDEFSFFTILFDCYLGWWYPFLLGVLFISNYMDFVSHRRANAVSSGTEFRRLKR
jgi:hypothetical protein